VCAVHLLALTARKQLQFSVNIAYTVAYAAVYTATKRSGSYNSHIVTATAVTAVAVAAAGW
jgi:hypothetical protein